jgi:hypothetical protein
MKRFGKIALAALALALVGIGGPSLRGDGGEQSRPHWRQFVIDVAEDARTGVLNQVNPTNALPKRGDTFIENAKIFPGGTIRPAPASTSMRRAASALRCCAAPSTSTSVKPFRGQIP